MGGGGLFVRGPMLFCQATTARKENTDLFLSRADPDAPRRMFGRVFRIFCPVSCQNTPAPPRYPAKTTGSRRLITQTRRKSAGFAPSSQPSGHTSPVAAFWRHYRGSIKRRDSPLAGAVYRPLPDFGAARRGESGGKRVHPIHV
jgi:hypothetical protein